MELLKQAQQKVERKKKTLSKKSAKKQILSYFRMRYKEQYQETYVPSANVQFTLEHILGLFDEDLTLLKQSIDWLMKHYEEMPNINLDVFPRPSIVVLHRWGSYISQQLNKPEIDPRFGIL